MVPCITVGQFVAELTLALEKHPGLAQFKLAINDPDVEELLPIQPVDTARQLFSFTVTDDDLMYHDLRLVSEPQVVMNTLAINVGVRPPGGKPA